MRFVDFLLRLLGFVQWLAAVAVAALCVAAQVDTLEEADDVASDMPGEFDLGGLDLVVVSASITLPGLLLSISLMLSAIYCSQASNRRWRPRPKDTQSETLDTMD